MPMPDALAPLPVVTEAADQLEAQLIGMVLDSVTSLHSSRSYEKGLGQFFAWCREQSRVQPLPSFSKALVRRLPLLAARPIARPVDDQPAPLAGAQAGPRDGRQWYACPRHGCGD